MKAVLTYWVMGCVLMGLLYGAGKAKCPNDDVSAEHLVAWVAIWPAVLAYPFTAPTPSSVCKRLP